ncbi:MAG: outer membrane lipoprotein-sorting protein [Candidatus Binatia bacterium]
MADVRTVTAAWRLGGAAVLAAATLAGAQDDPKELVRQALAEAALKPAIARVTFTSGSQSREVEIRRKRDEGGDRIHIEVTAPFNYKGVRYVFLEEAGGHHDHYTYLPALKRTVRISEESLSQPFLATEFYVADMIPPQVDAYTYGFVGEEEIAGRKCRLVERVPTSGRDALYGKTILAVDPADRLIVRTEFFEPDGRPLKVWTVERFEKVDGVWTALEQTMRALETGVEWKLTVAEIRYGVTLDDGDFQPIGLDG